MALNILLSFCLSLDLLPSQCRFRGYCCTISHSDTLHSVGLLWSRERPVAETSIPGNTQHLQGTDIHTPGGIRTRNPNKRAAADPRLRPAANMIGILTLILPRSRTGTVWFYTSTSNKRAAQPKLYTKSLTRDLKLMYSRLTLVRISINL